MSFLSTVPQKEYPLDQANTLVISGGGIKGISALGALFYFEKTYEMKISSYVGTSVGAIICTLLAIGYKSIEIKYHIEKQKFFNDIQKLQMHKLLNGQGILPWQIISHHLEKMIRDKVGYIPTFRDIKNRFGNHLTIVAFNVTDRRPEFFNVDTHPNLSVIEAIRMSANVPLLFDRCRYNGKEYLDGGLICNYPIGYYHEAHHKILGINLGGENMVFGDENYIQFLLAILSMPYNYHNPHKIEGCVQDLNIPSTASAFNFNLTEHQRKEMFNIGFQLAKTKFPQPEPIKTMPLKKSASV